jgi:hypothetical protein
LLLLLRVVALACQGFAQLGPVQLLSLLHQVWLAKRKHPQQQQQQDRAGPRALPLLEVSACGRQVSFVAHKHHWRQQQQQQGCAGAQHQLLWNAAAIQH